MQRKLTTFAVCNMPSQAIIEGRSMVFGHKAIKVATKGWEGR
jgi:hypothetical protein